MAKRLSFPDNLWPKIDRRSEDECWPWLGGLGQGGYGQIKIDGRTCRATRALWALLYGEIEAGLMVCHRCDNPRCMNPAHLFLATHRQNVDDCVAKGRQTRTHGEQNGMAKLTDAQVRGMRARYAAGQVMQKELAREYGVDGATIWRALNGLAWRHVE